MLLRLGGFLLWLLLAGTAHAQVGGGGGGGGISSITCPGGQSITAISIQGIATCGNPLATGTINTGGPQALAGYLLSGTAISPLTIGSGLTLSAGQLSPNLAVLAALASPTFTGTPLAPTAVTATNTTQIATTAYVRGQGFTLGSTAITLASGTVGTLAGLTLTSPTIAGAAMSGTITGAPTFSGGPTITSPAISGPIISGIASFAGNASFGGGMTNTLLTNAPLLGTDVSGNFRAITVDGTSIILTGTTLSASGGGGGGSVTWPVSGAIVISNSTNSPGGLAPVNNDLLYAANGAWTPLSTAANSVLCTSSLSVPSLCSSATMQTLLGYLTSNQTITLSGDASGSGTTSIAVTNPKVNGVAYPAAPATNTVPVITGSNQITYLTGSGLAGQSGFGSMLTQAASNVAITGGTITGIAAAVNPGDVPNKAYVDAAITGAILHTQVMAATAAALPNTPVVASGTGVGKTLTAAANAALVVDGYTVLLNDRVLVKNQAAPADNGIYTQTTLGVGGSVKWVLTRATDFDQAAAGEVALGAYMFVVNGTANTKTIWQLGAPTPVSITVDTTSLTFNQLNSAATVSADGTTILNTGGVLSVIPSGALDLLTSTRGSLVERGVSGWVGIPPVATAGFVLTNNGTGTDPTYQAIVTGVSGQASGKLAIGGAATTITSNIGFATTSTVNTIAEMGAGGLLDPGMLPLATAAAFGVVKCGTGTTCTGGTITATAGIDTGTTGIAAAGTTLASATDLTTQQNYVATGANCTTLANGCIGSAAVRFDTALMVAFNKLLVCNEDPTNALLVYPDTTGHTINNQGAGVGIPIPANQCTPFVAKSTTALRTVP